MNGDGASDGECRALLAPSVLFKRPSHSLVADAEIRLPTSCRIGLHQSGRGCEARRRFVGIVAPLHLAQAGGVGTKGGGDGTRVADFVRAQVVAIASAGKVRRQGCIPVMGDGHSPKRAIIVSMASSLNVARKFAFQ